MAVFMWELPSWVASQNAWLAYGVLGQTTGVPSPFFDISPVPDEGRLESCYRGGEGGMSFSNGMHRLCMAEAKALGDLVSSH